MDLGNPSDIANFFYAGQVDVDAQIQSEVLAAIIQPKRTMFYARGEGAGVLDYENTPMTIQNQIALKYDIVMAITRRNAQVPDGSDGGVDFRVAVSQNGVTVEQIGEEIVVSVMYIPLYSLKPRRIPAIPLGGRLR